MCKRMVRFIMLLSYFCMLTQAHSDDSGIWRKIREGTKGYSAVSDQESHVLIQASGTNWLFWRNELMAGTGAWGIAFTVLALGCFYIFRGQVKLTQPRSGELIERWNRKERWLHFYTAIVFIILAFTGLSLLYGRSTLIEWLGHADFSTYAQLAKIIHNYLGPLFIIGLLMMVLTWFNDNLWNKSDIIWFKQFGGLMGKHHPSAGRMNAGEKAWFWLLIVAGLLVSASGLLLDFPNFGQQRIILQFSHIVHSLSAILLIMGALGHIYIGTIGTEGALEGMITGKVDKSWAIQHHDLWYQQHQQSSVQSSEGSEEALDNDT